jgi:flagellar motor component MotA
MARQRIMVPYPPDVIAEIDKIVSHGQRTAFLIELAKREIKLNRQRKALGAATGAWKQEDHPELAEGAAKWVREIRQESVKRFEKIEQHHQEAK